jgi:hypothetical protein
MTEALFFITNKCKHQLISFNVSKLSINCECSQHCFTKSFELRSLGYRYFLGMLVGALTVAELTANYTLASGFTKHLLYAVSGGRMFVHTPTMGIESF